MPNPFPISLAITFFTLQKYKDYWILQRTSQAWGKNSQRSSSCPPFLDILVEYLDQGYSSHYVKLKYRHMILQIFWCHFYWHQRRIINKRWVLGKLKLFLNKTFQKEKIMDTIHSSANNYSGSADTNDLGRWRISISGRWKWPWQVEIW